MSEGALDFFVLTGFLGSGKTTLLRDFLERPEAADTAVIVNEVGEIGLDGVVLREGGGDLPMAMLSNGCVCCQIGSDLAFTIDRLIMSPRPDGAGPLRRIILETSGLSMPGPVLRTLATLAEHRMRVAVIGTFDLTRGTEVAGFDEAVAQWAASHRIVATKTDLVPPDDLAAAPSAIAARQSARRGDRRRGSRQRGAGGLRAADIGAALARDRPRSRHARIRASRSALRSRQATWHFPISRPGSTILPARSASGCCRIKGLVRVTESEPPLLIESVGTMFSPPRPLKVDGAPPSSFLVIIARDVDEAELEPVAPVGLFQFSSWKKPVDALARDDRRAIKAEWVV